jgi:hypothetical protein
LACSQFGPLTGRVRAGTLPVPRSELSPYQVIRAQSAVVHHGDREFPAPAVLYDGTGLTHENPLLASHGSDPATIWQYPVSPDEYPVGVEFDLGGGYFINEMWIWQLQGEGLEDQGLLEFDILMRDFAHREVGLVEGTLDDFKRVGIQPVQRFNAFGECIFLPVPDCVRYVELRIKRNRGNSQWLGLAEVAFAGWNSCSPVPEPSALMLVAGGLGLFPMLGRASGSRRRVRCRAASQPGDEHIGSPSRPR